MDQKQVAVDRLSTPAQAVESEDPPLIATTPGLPELSDRDASDRQRFESLLSKHRRKLTLYLVSLVRNADDAEDLCQRCSVVMWKKFSQFDERRSFFSWACGIARLEVQNYRRAVVVRPMIFKSEVISLLAESVETLDRTTQAHRLAALQKCISRLSETEKTFLRRIYWEGCSLEAIARELGCSPRTFYNRIYLLRKKLSQCVARHMEAE
jgi:RNA polymerase sigma-70 factor, Rhodopirellula/Verrucomicrobium family